MPHIPPGPFRLQRFQRGVRKWWRLRIECPNLIVLFGGRGGMCATRLGSYGRNGLLPTEYGRGPVTEERGAFVPQKP